MVPWCLIILLISVVKIGVYSHLDSNGFLNIDCGLPVNSNYTDPGTNFIYVSDEQFIDTGANFQISSSNNLQREYMTVRSFPIGIRNCYKIALTPGFNYLIRATFYYGNYDNLNNNPTFDIYLGVNYWDTVEDIYYDSEIIVTATDDNLQVCLVNKKLGYPFISSLYLRQLNPRIYQYANATQSLILVERANLGASKEYELIGYPADTHDRWWWNETLPGAMEISTNSTIETDGDFETPYLVMHTAAAKEPLNISWKSNSESTRFYMILHFADVQETSNTDLREFTIYANGNTVLNRPYRPYKLKSDPVISVTTGYTNYNISLAATSNSTLPPLLNAFERYIISPVGVTTYGKDVDAINEIKEEYHIKNGWSGDPCLPKEFIWTGVNCTSNSDKTRITALNLSSSGLTGPISAYFGKLNALVTLDLSKNYLSGALNYMDQLTALQYLDLSSNDLSGPLPSSLDKLTALTYFDIRGNSKIESNLPPELQKKQQNKSLTYMFGDINPNPSPSSKKNITISLGVVVPLLVIAVVVATVFWLRKHNQSIIPNPNGSCETSLVGYDNARNYANNTEEGNPYGNYDRRVATISPLQEAAAQGFLNIDNRQFSYNDLKRITNGFKNNIGIGGFGSVYLGLVENQLQVAVKMRSHLSTQGVMEFMAEARNLTRVHHKNLVKLIGYCIDGNCMALVYEYMQEGNLQQKLKDDVRPLTWMQRLRIAYQSAQGLEYLHKACDPPLIHRDVKTSNILLSANLEAKIADFGLSRVFDCDTSTVSTRIVGTSGYLDPGYYLSNQLSAKSDVYSFGVVLLEIITGQPPIIIGRGDLTQWVRQKLSGGNIESIVDPKIQNKYDINSVWKVTEVACSCTEYTSSRRPTMSAVVSELKESLDLEISTEKLYKKSSTDNLITDISQDIAFEMAYMNGMQEPGTSVR